MKEVKCSHCGKVIITNNKEHSGDIIIKSRLVFLNEDGNVLCRCLQCKKPTSLPLNFVKSSNSIKIN